MNSYWQQNDVGHIDVFWTQNTIENEPWEAITGRIASWKSLKNLEVISKSISPMC